MWLENCVAVENPIYSVRWSSLRGLQTLVCVPKKMSRNEATDQFFRSGRPQSETGNA